MHCICLMSLRATLNHPALPDIDGLCNSRKENIIMETDEQTPKKQHKKVLHSHKKQYFIYNIIKTKEMLSKKVLSA